MNMGLGNTVITQAGFESWLSRCQLYDLENGLLKCCFSTFLKRSEERSCLTGRDVAKCSTPSGQGSPFRPQKPVHLAGDASRRGGHGFQASHRSWVSPEEVGHTRAGSGSLQPLPLIRLGLPDLGRPSETLPGRVSCGGWGLGGAGGL